MNVDTTQIQRRLKFFGRLDNETEDPAFILAGAVPDYQHRLPPEYNVCVRLGSHFGVPLVYYSPRQFEVDEERRTVTLHDGTLDGDSDGEVEFSVTIDAANIVASLMLNPAGYTGPPLHEL